MNRCDTCKYAEWECSEVSMTDVCTDCTLGFRSKFESDDDCGRYKMKARKCVERYEKWKPATKESEEE